MPRTTVSVMRAMETVADLLSGTMPNPERPVCYLPGNAGRIAPVEDWIFANAKRMKNVDIFQALALGPAKGWENAVLGGVGIVTPFIGPGVRQLVNTGLARNIRANLSQVPRLCRGRWKPTVAFAHVSPPDSLGRVTLGLNAGLDITPVKHAGFKVAIINREMPRWHIMTYYDRPTGRIVQAGCEMFLSDFDLVVEIDEPLLEHGDKDSAVEKPESKVIAQNILKFLHANPELTSGNGPTLQLGIGRIPNAIASAFAQEGTRVGGIWSELISDGVLHLYESGLVDNIAGSFLREHIVCGIIMGSRGLYDAMHENPHFAVVPQDVVNDPSMIRWSDRMVSINSAIAVSLTGEVAASTIRKCYYSDVGGQFDFALGASWAEHGASIIALHSTSERKGGTRESKIVSTHSEGAHHTISADLPVVVVTEEGIADLRGKNDHDRVEAMINVAHPVSRVLLAREARAMPSFQGIGTLPARLIALLDGRTAVLRPASTPDIPLIKDYIERLSADDLRTRYMGTINVSALTGEERLMRIYHDTLDYLTHAAFVVELSGEIIGITHAFQVAPGSYEVSLSRRSDLRGQGIGRNLLRMLIDWAIETGVETLHAVTYRTENPRMRALFDRFGFVATNDPDDQFAVNYSARVSMLAEGSFGDSPK